MPSIHCLTQGDDISKITPDLPFEVINPITGEYHSYLVKEKGKEVVSQLKVLNLKNISNENIEKFKEERGKYLSDQNSVEEERAIHLAAYNVMVLVIPHSCKSLSNESFEYQHFNRFSILDSVCDSLINLNKVKLCHGCLSLSNITIHEDNSYKLRNYGLNGISNNYDLSYDDFCYLSPEVVTNKEFDIKADVWSFGCIVYSLLTGRRLFHSSNVKYLAGQIYKGKYTIGENECNEKESRFIQDLVKVKPDDRIKIEDLKGRLEKIKDEKFEPESDIITLDYVMQMAKHKVPIVDEEKLAVIGQKGLKHEATLFGQALNAPGAPSTASASGAAMEEEKKEEEEEPRLLDQVINKFNELRRDVKEERDIKDYLFGLLVNLSFRKIYFAYIKEKMQVNGIDEYDQILRCVKCNDFKPEEYDTDRIGHATIALELKKRDINNNNNNNNNNNTVDEENFKLIKLFTKILPELCYIHDIELLHTDKETTDKILKYITNNVDRDNLRKFRKIKLNGSYATKDSMKIFSDALSSSQHKNLKVLYFEDNQLGDDGLTYLVSKSCHIINLEELYVSSNSITSKGINILTNSLRSLIHLSALSIAKNKQLDPKSIIRLLKGLRHCPYIDFLCFSETGVDDNVMAVLVDGMKQHLFKQLVMLILNNNNISDKGAKQLIQCLGKTRSDSVCPKMGILDLNSNDKMKDRSITSCVFDKEKPWYEFSS